MSRILDDLRLGARGLAKAPGATLTVLVALSLGIGLPTLMFSLIRGALLPTLPFENGERIVRITRLGDAPVTAKDFEVMVARQRSFDGLGAVATAQVTVAFPGRTAEPIQGASMDPSVLPLLAVSPVLGRAFTAADAAPAAPPVVLIGEALWRDRLDSDPDALGSTVRLSGRDAEIIGIMPEGFGFPWNDQLWSPLRVDPLRDVLALSSESEGTLAFVVGRLRQGVGPGAAAEDLSGIIRQADLEAGVSSTETSRVGVVSYTNIFSSAGQRAGIAGLMLGVAMMVLLVACANVTNVTLARAAARGREVAIRTAMGASRPRIVGQFLAEVAWLAALGGAGGASIALLGTTIIQNLTVRSTGTGAPFWIGFRVDGPVLWFVALLAGLATLTAGLAPALQASRANPYDLIRDGARGASGFHMGRVMRRLVGVEMALSFVLLVGAGLFIRSAANYERLEFAFDPTEVLQARIRLPETYDTYEARAQFAGEAAEALRAIPEIEMAALASAVPGIGSSAAGPFEVEGVLSVDEAARPRARWITVTPGYFDLFRSPVIRGRDFEEGDRASTLPVAIVNTAFERRYLATGAVDRRVRIDTDGDGEPELRTVVGVVPDLLPGGVGRELEEAVYVPVAQAPSRSVMVLARPVAGFASLPTPVRAALAELDPDVPLVDVRVLRTAIDAANAQYTWLSALFLTAGAIALFLAALGLYGVMAFWVGQRTREIGVRMALGGERRRIVGLVLRQGMTHTGLGLVIGVALAIPFARLLGAALFEVSPYDPVVFGSIATILAAAAWLGCWIPARRATRINPLEALAEE